MKKRHAGIWHIAREYVTHWSVAGAILAATGTAPEHWFAELLSEVHFPHEALPDSLMHVDYRLLAVIAGLSVVVGDNLWRHHRHLAPAAKEYNTPSSVDIPGTTPNIDPLHFQAPPEGAALSDKPSIAVLPFSNMSADPDQEYFSDGMADDIITELSRNRALLVIARNSSFSFKGRAVDVKQIARELGARYVVEGSVRRAGERVRVAAQLIDAETGIHIWAERYDRHVADVFAVQDEVTAAVTLAIAPAVAQAERQRTLRKPPDSLDAWETYQRGLWYLTNGSQANIEQALACFQRAVERDPMFVAAHAMLGLHYIYAIIFEDPASVHQGMREAEKHARAALAIDPEESSALGVLAWAALGAGHLDVALDLADHAIMVNPNDAAAYMHKGRAMAFMGRPREAIASLQTALRLSPRDPLGAYMLNALMLAEYLSRDYTAAARTAQIAVRDYPEAPLNYRWLAASLGQLGRMDEAHHALCQAMTLSPRAFDFFVRSRPPWFRPEDHEHMLDGLQKAGWER